MWMMQSGVEAPCSMRAKKPLNPQRKEITMARKKGRKKGGRKHKR